MLDLRTFDLNLLVALDALVAERSVTAAARRVGIGQPAMSYLLGRLRDLFGDPLLVRAGNAMRPTPRALELAGAVARVLDDIRRTVLADQVFRPETEERTFRLGASDYAAVAVLPSVLAQLDVTAPRVRIVVRPVARDEVASRLEDGSVDLAVGHYPDPRTALRAETLFHEEHVCLFDASACGVRPPIGLDDYLSLPHLLVTSRGDIGGVLDAGLAREGHRRFVRLSTSSFLSIPFLLRGARAVAAVPARLARDCQEAIGLAVSPLPVQTDGFDVALVWHARGDADPAQRWFRDRVREATAAGRDGSSP